jgi:hypothetical protein
MATATGLSDDWQEVNDDSFSVVSVPTSDDDDQSHLTQDQAEGGDANEREDVMEEEKQQQQQSHQPLMTAERDRQPGSAFSLPVRSNPPSYVPSEPQVEPGMDDVERHGMDTRDTVEPEDEDEYDSGEGLNELLDVDISPTFLCKVATSLIKLLQEINGLLEFQANVPQIANADKIKHECLSLIGHLEALEPVLTGYSKHWSLDKPAQEIPLDPGLYECLSDLRIELLGLQALLQGHLQCGGAFSSTRSSTEDHYSKLSSFSTQFSGFVPIMRSDYEEFHLAQMTFLSISEAESSRHEPVTNRSHQHLRREVYNLKDQVQDCIDEISSYLQHIYGEDGDSSSHPLANIRTSYIAIKFALGIMLSNNPSDWIDYGLSGGLTYARFHELNPDTVRSLSLQLKDVVDDLTQQRRLASSSRNGLSSAALRARNSQIDSLYSIEEVLVSLFRTRPSSPSERDQLDDYGRRFMITS